jgi:hypothetical protein
MPITDLITTIAEDIRTIDKHHLMVMLHLTNLITKQVKKVPSYIFDLQVIVSAELLKRGVSIADL